MKKIIIATLILSATALASCSQKNAKEKGVLGFYKSIFSPKETLGNAD